MEIKILDLKTMCETEPEPINFILPGLAAGTCGAAVSPGGTGKSMLALQIAMLKSSSEKGRLKGLFGEADLLKIAYISAEDPANILHQRIHAVAHAPGGAMSEKNIDAFHQNCKIYPVYGSGLDIKTGAGAAFLRSVAEGQQLVIVDTLRRVHTADENSNGEMSQVLGVAESIARDTNAAILFLHHVPKSNPNFVNIVSARGASAITDNLRYVASLRHISDKEAEGFGVAATDRWQHTVFSVIKSNYAMPTPDSWLVRENKGVLSLLGEVEHVLRGPIDNPQKQQQLTASGGNNGSC